MESSARGKAGAKLFYIDPFDSCPEDFNRLENTGVLLGLLNGLFVALLTGFFFACRQSLFPWCGHRELYLGFCSQAFGGRNL